MRTISTDDTHKKIVEGCIKPFRFLADKLIDKMKIKKKRVLFSNSITSPICLIEIRDMLKI